MMSASERVDRNACSFELGGIRPCQFEACISSEIQQPDRSSPAHIANKTGERRAQSRGLCRLRWGCRRSWCPECGGLVELRLGQLDRPLVGVAEFIRIRAIACLR